jgi:hypothetical protein
VLKKLSYILILIAVLIIQGHDVFTHHHDLPNDHQAATHHDGDDHNAYSFVDIDEEFTLQNKIDINNVFASILSPNVLEIASQKPSLITLFVPKNEYPPPKPSISFQSLRGPPIS